MSIKASNDYPEPKLKVGCRALAQYAFNPIESLPLPIVAQQPKDLLDVIYNRTSERQFAASQLNDLAPLFSHVSRNKSNFKDPYSSKFEKRNYASAGALHSIHSVITELAGDHWYCYNAHSNCFDQIRVKSQLIESFKDDCRQLLMTTQNAWLIWYVCDLDRLNSRYHAADNLIFREAGHLAATHSLVAEYYQLAYCPMGFFGYEAASELTCDRHFIGVGSALVAKRDE